MGKSVCYVSISINDGVVPVVESARDLGVLITKSLSPSVHINDVVSKANQRAAAILRAFVKASKAKKFFYQGAGCSLYTPLCKS